MASDNAANYCSDDDPVRRLVFAMVGSDDEHVIALAERVLGSSTNSNQSTDLSSVMLHISNKVRDTKSADEIKQLYNQFEQECPEHNLPANFLLILTKLMGKKIPIFTPKNISGSESNQKTKKTQNGEINKDELIVPLSAPTSTKSFVGMAVQNKGNLSSFESTTPLYQQRNELRNTADSNGSHLSTIPKEQFVLTKDELQQEEEVLLRECLYSLQGINGERIRYYHRDPKDEKLPDVSNYEGIRIDSLAVAQNLLYSTGQLADTRLGGGALDALKICGEAGWLYTRIQSYIRLVQQDRTKGVVARAFAEALAEQLRDYHSLLTTYENKLPGFTLRQMLVELRGPTFRLKVLAMLVDGLQEFTGGRLLRSLHKHSIHGNTVHVTIVKSILYKACRPWFEILYSWTTKGVLLDPWNEFFVVENVNIDNKHFWKNKYHVNEDQVPIGILDLDLVQPALNLGKGINFIRSSLNDGQWTMRIQDIATNEGDNEIENNLGYRYQSHENGNLENFTLKKTLDSATILVHSHILCALKEENHLMHHLFALKQFLLLGQGDFFSALMEGLYSKSKITGESSGMRGFHKHSLLLIVEGAVRSTNAKNFPQYITDRLQVELVLDPVEEMNGTRGQTHLPRKNALKDCRKLYDAFTLDYQIPDPIIPIVHPGALDQYKMVFSLLFRLKRIEFMLNLTWQQSATLQHALQTSAQYTGIDVSSSTGYARATFLLRSISILRQSMSHIIVSLKSYLMFDVIEGGWQELELAMNEVSTLDEAIDAHDNYLCSIIRKTMVKVEEPYCFPNQNLLAERVDVFIDIVNTFCDLQETLFDRSLTEAEIAAQKRLDAERRLKQGHWGFDSQQDTTEQEKFFGLANCSTLENLSKISDEYNAHVVSLLNALNDCVDGNASHDMYDDLHPHRFLAAQLDHNKYYANQELNRTTINPT